MGRQSDSYWPLLIGPERERASGGHHELRMLREGSEVGINIKNAASDGHRLSSLVRLLVIEVI
jgi:hypothetical protein